jgi:PAP2 superfamily
LYREHHAWQVESKAASRAENRNTTRSKGTAIASISAAADGKFTPMRPGWSERIRQRLIRYWALKAFGTSIFMALFFVGYFSILEHPRGEPTVMPQVWLDQWVGFTPAAFVVYVSLWVYVSLPPALMGNFRALVQFGLWVGAMCVFCLTLFWVFPTQMPESGIDWSDYPGLALIKGIDAAGNAFPSLHVASAVFTACWLGRILSQLHAPRSLTWLSSAYCLAIVWSTMATRQHVALDALSGTAVGLLFAACSLWHVRRTD